ncbi:oxidoreductase [Nocardia mangyaensis]|uniref:Oxidoreductase n=1 Tax=Nocardia mangyaensis TaxID=2213200 RepID=A0A1J0W3J6_9NOCA|nr:FAD-dependent oxidoreductase [Nocardia mangyaensis]APE38868.1 oxidoreductase [Nocardia mangyaensis]
MTEQHRIVVLGAGYAGLAAARRLAKKSRDTAITVVDARAEFVERVRLHQEAAGQSIKHWDLRELLERKGIEFVRARVVELDPVAKRIRLADGAVTDSGPQHAVDGLSGERDNDRDSAHGRADAHGLDQPVRVLDYDTLVYALGSAADRRGVPGVAEHARSVATPEEVRAVPAGPVVVVGAGATGIELAAELAEAQPDSPVTLISANEPGAWLSPRAVDSIRATLTRLGVDIRADAKVVEVLPDGVRLADGTTIPAVTTVWTAGFTVPDLARRAGLAVDDLGRVRTDATLRSLSHPDIYAAGDAALMAGPGDRELRMACATAIPAGGYVATAIIARARGHEPEPMKFRYYLQCISLGRRDAVIQILQPDDTPGARVLTGRTGAWVKELVVRGAGISVRMR